MKKYIDRKLLLILISFMGAYHLVYILRRIILKVMERPEYNDVSWRMTVFEPIFANFIIVPPIVVLVLIFTKFLIEKGMKWTYVVLIHFMFSFVYSFLITAFGYFYENTVYGLTPEQFSIELFITRMMFGANLNFLGYIGFITIIYSYTYIQKTTNSEIQKLLLEQHLQKARMESLKSQLNPHFLFNTLNSITSLIKKDSYKAQHMIGNLGDLLRETLQLKEQNLITVHREVKVLEKYIAIMHHRFSDSLLFDLFVDKESDTALIPSLLLQPIIENSIKHGHLLNSTHLKVVLNIIRQDNWLVITVKNNGAPILENYDGDGIGIQNIQERLRTMFKNDYVFSFTNLKSQSGVITTIKIPYLESSPQDG